MDTKKTNEIAQSIQSKFKIIFLEDTLMAFKGGVYVEIRDTEIDFWIKQYLNECYGISIKNEIKACLKAGAFMKADQLLLPDNLINVKNGLFNLETGILEDHDSKYHFLSQINCNYDPTATCEEWFKFLGDTFRDDHSKAEVVGEFFGYCLSAVTNLEKALMLIGNGANGKSVILNVLLGLLGEKNCSAVPMEQFKNVNYLATLLGKMVNISTETNTKANIYEAVFKQLVSGETIMAENKYTHPFSFKNTCKLAFAFNEPPKISDKTDAFYRRLLTIKLLYQVPPELQDKNLSQKLLLEKSGILNWAIGHLNNLSHTMSFSNCDSINEAVDEYRADNNPVISFVEDECCLGVDKQAEIHVLYKSYQDYCTQNGFHPLSNRNFSKQLRGIIKCEDKEFKIGGNKALKGIALKMD